MKKSVRVLCVLSALSSVAFGMPEAPDRLISGLMEKESFSDLLTANMGENSMRSKFNSIKVEVVAKTDELVELCGTPARSRSGSVLQVSVTQTTDNVESAEVATKKIYYATAHRADGLVLCD